MEVRFLCLDNRTVGAILHGTPDGRGPLNEIVGRTRPLGPNIYKRAEVLAGLPEEVSYR